MRLWSIQPESLYDKLIVESFNANHHSLKFH